MSPPIHFAPGGETLLAVAAGALLATIGGFLGNRLEHHIETRAKERSAALFFSEIFSALKVIITFAEDTRKRGNPYGEITMRTVKGAQREALAYDQNRETRFHLRDALLRAKTQSLLIRLTIAFDGILDSHNSLRSIEEAAGTPDPARLERLRSERAGSFEYMLELRDEIASLLVRFKGITKLSLEAYDTIALDIGANLRAPLRTDSELGGSVAGIGQARSSQQT